MANDLGCIWRHKPSFFCSCCRLPLGAALNPKAGPDATQKPRGLRKDFRFNFAYLSFLGLGEDPAARSHRVEQVTARWRPCLQRRPQATPTCMDFAPHRYGKRSEQQVAKADSTLRSSQAVPHPSTNRALRRLTSEVERDPVHSTRYGRQRRLMARSRHFVLIS